MDVSASLSADSAGPAHRPAVARSRPAPISPRVCSAGRTASRRRLPSRSRASSTPTALSRIRLRRRRAGWRPRASARAIGWHGWARTGLPRCGCCWGCSWLGAIYLPLNSRLAPPEHRWILEHAQPGLLVADAGFEPHVRMIGTACETRLVPDEPAGPTVLAIRPSLSITATPTSALIASPATTPPTARRRPDAARRSIRCCWPIPRARRGTQGLPCWTRQRWQRTPSTPPTRMTSRVATGCSPPFRCSMSAG